MWSKLSEELDRSCEDIQNELSLIIKRRNQIAHESDYDPSVGMKRDITEEDLKRARNFLTSFVERVDTWI